MIVYGLNAVKILIDRKDPSISIKAENPSKNYEIFKNKIL